MTAEMQTEPTEATPERPQWVTPADVQDIRAAQREGRPNNPWLWRSSAAAKCCQCKQVIKEPVRLVFMITGLQWQRYMHSDEQQCKNNILATQQGRRLGSKPKPITVKVAKPYVARKGSWVLDTDEQLTAEYIKDARFPRRVTACRICGNDILADEQRSAFTLKDEATTWTLKQGFVHTRHVDQRQCEETIS